MQYRYEEYRNTGIRNLDDGSQEPFIIPFQDMMDGSFSWFEKQQISTCLYYFYMNLTK